LSGAHQLGTARRGEELSAAKRVASSRGVEQSLRRTADAVAPLAHLPSVTVDLFGKRVDFASA